MEYFTGFFDFGARFESWQTIAKDSRLELSTGPGLQAVLDGSFGGIVSGRTCSCKVTVADSDEVHGKDELNG